MNDDLPRLPASKMQVVLNLGPKRAATLMLPRGLEHPQLDAEWDDETRTTAVSVEYENRQLHLDVSDDGVEYHFHGRSGNATDTSPFSATQTDPLMTWALLFASDVHALMPGLEEEAGEAGAWHDAGFTIYTCESEPAQLDLLEVDIAGAILTLPWLGSGQVDQRHVEGEDHPIELVWDPTSSLQISEHGFLEGGTPIAKAWLDRRTERPRTSSMRGVDWARVGLAEAEVLSWLEGVYLNHHIIEDPASAVFIAALERVSGLDRA